MIFFYFEDKEFFRINLSNIFNFEDKEFFRDNLPNICICTLKDIINLYSFTCQIFAFKHLQTN